MKRLLMLVVIASSVGAQSAGQIQFGSTAQIDTNEPIFEVTCPKVLDPNEPVTVHAKDRIWAMVELGCTVWTEKEWADAQKLEEDAAKHGIVPFARWIADPSAGHYDCPDGWMAYAKSEPPVYRDGPIAANAVAIYIPPRKDKKGHLIGEQPSAPICIQESKP
jgi:hypothetical protein